MSKGVRSKYEFKQDADANEDFEDVTEVQLGIDPQNFHYFDANGVRLG